MLTTFGSYQRILESMWKVSQNIITLMRAALVPQICTWVPSTSWSLVGLATWPGHPVPTAMSKEATSTVFERMDTMGLRLIKRYKSHASSRLELDVSEPFTPNKHLLL